jgi:hypothetical protein
LADVLKGRSVARRPLDKVTYRRWGAVTAVTEIKPPRRWQQLRLGLVFAFGNATTIAIRPLLKMKVIALARWTLWPNARDARYLLFETNWSGSDQTYIPDFGRIMPLQWASIWGATTIFPGAIPTTGLLDWVDQIDFGVGHFWTDYELGASTAVIEQALALQTRVREFLDETMGVSAAEFDRRWRELVVSVHRQV